MALKIVVAGRAGRMAQVLAQAVRDAYDCELLGQLARGDDALPLIAKAEALIDFTRPAMSVELAALAAQARIVHVIGTTGFSDEEEAKIHAAARHAVIVKSGNMSLGVTLLAALVKQAAHALPNFDIEIVEMHHRQKVDAPSGTALLLGRAATEGRNVSLDAVMAKTRDGLREEGSIGFASLRGGTIVGEHEVVLAG